MRRLIFTLLPALPIFTSAQTYVRKECTAELEYAFRDLYACSDGGLLSVNYPTYDEKLVPTVTYFDPQMNLVYNNPLPELLGHNFLASLFNGQRLLVFGAAKDGVEVAYNVDPKTGKVTGAPLTAFSLSGKPVITGALPVFSGASLDSTHFYVVTETQERHVDGAIFSGVVLDKDLNPSYTFTYTTAEKDPYGYIQQTFTLSNTGYLNILYGQSVKTTRDNFTPTTYYAVQINPKGKAKELQISGLPQGNLGDMAWIARDDKVAFTGLLQKNRKLAYTDILSGICTPATGRVSDLVDYQVAQLPALKDGIQPYQKSLVKNGINTGVVLINQYYLSDGSAEYVYEARSSRTYTSYYNPVDQVNGFGRSSGSTQIYSAWDTFVLKLDPKHQLQWLVEGQKATEEADAYIHSTTACAIDKNGGLHMFYYDSRKWPQVMPDKYLLPLNLTSHFAGNETITSIYVAPDGQAKKIFLYDKKDLPKDYYWAFAFSTCVRAGQLVYLTMDGRKTFTLDKLYNKSKYHLGTIDIN